MKTKYKIIRTAVGCPSTISLIKKLQDNDVFVVGTDSDYYSVGLQIADKSYVVPMGNDDSFIDKMINICKREEPDMIISGPEEEIINFSKHKKLFDDLGVLLLMPDYDTVSVCVDKSETYKLFQSLGIPTPETYNTHEELIYPCIIKPNNGRGGRGVHILKDHNDYIYYHDKIKNPLYQEIIYGIEYSVDTFADMDGNVLSIVPRKRVHAESGICVKGITVDDPLIIEYTKKIVEELRLYGPSCIQCIKDKYGIPKFFEINSRFGGGSILSIDSDPSILQNLLRMIRHEKPVKSNGFSHGNMMFRYYSELYIGG